MTLTIPKIKCKNLLILKGVYPEDFTNPQPASETSCVGPQYSDVYTELPKRFTGVSGWISFSNLKCWECDQLPDGYPKFIPMHPEKDENGYDVCDVHGHFCEWNCAVRYAIKEFSREQKWDILSAICLFESKFSGKRKEKILPAPPKTLMRAYCGNQGISPEAYKEKIHALNSDYELTTYKLEHFITEPAT